MIYLDHAATSWPKPDAVTAAVLRWYTDLGVSAERGDCLQGQIPGPEKRGVRP